MYDSRDPSATTPEVRQNASREAEQTLALCTDSNSLHGLRIGIPQVG